MIKTRQLLPLALVAGLVAACGAGNPQNETVRAEQSLALPPITTTSSEARQEVADGLRELDLGRAEEAYAHFKRATAADPNLAIAYLFAFNAGNATSSQESNANLEKAVALASHGSATEKLIIEVNQKLAKNDVAGAVQSAQQLVKTDSTSPRSWLLLSTAYSAQGEEQKTRETALKATELAPRFALSYLLLSASYSFTDPKDYSKGELYARKLVELLPNEPVAHDFLGDALRGQGKLQQAAAEYSKQAELDPTKGDGLQQRGHVNTFLGRYAEARADYDAAVAVATGNSKPGLGEYRAFVHLHEGSPQAAVEELEQLYNAVDGMNIPAPMDMKDLIGHDQLMITTLTKMIPQAESEVARLTELDGKIINQVSNEDFKRGIRGNMHLDAARLAIAKGDYAAARQHIDESIKIHAAETNPLKDRPAHDLLGLLALRQGNNAEAVKHFEQGTPDAVWAMYNHALALEGLGRKAEARKLYESIANNYFNTPGNALFHKDAVAKVKAIT